MTDRPLGFVTAQEASRRAGISTTLLESALRRQRVPGLRLEAAANGHRPWLVHHSLIPLIVHMTYRRLNGGFKIDPDPNDPLKPDPRLGGRPQ